MKRWMVCVGQGKLAHQLQQPLHDWDGLSSLCSWSGAAVDVRTHRQGLKSPSFIVANIRIRRQKTIEKTPAPHTLIQ